MVDQKIQLATSNSGWILCSWKACGGECCGTCSELIAKDANVYCESLGGIDQEYEYHCQQCAINTPERLESECEGWPEYAQNKGLT